MVQSRDFYFSAGPYHAALQSIYTALSTPAAFITLTGLPGTGKSRLCEKLGQILAHKNFRCSYFDQAFASPESLREHLAQRLDLPGLFELNQGLESCQAALEVDGRRQLLIFDDCHAWSDATLLELFRLTRVHQASASSVRVLICGEPQLDERLLADDKFRGLVQRVTQSLLLTVLSRDEVQDFVAAYLADAGLAPLPLESGALNLAHWASHGLPADLSAVAESIADLRREDPQLQALGKDALSARLKGEPLTGVVDRPEVYRSSRNVVSGPVIAVVVVLSIGFLYQLTGHDAPVTPVPDLAKPAEAFAAPLVSPFVDEAPAAVETRESAQRNSFLSVEDVDEPIIDAGLALVTALERGISADQIVKPEFEDVDAEEESDPATEVVPVPAPVALDVPTPEVAAIQVATPAEPVEPVTVDSAAAMESAVLEWVAVWQAQDIDAYFASYLPGFIPRYEPKDEWLQSRRRNIRRPQWIRLVVEDFTVVEQGDETGEVNFWLDYQSPSYHDRTLKKLQLQKTPTAWLIAEEINLRVEH